MNFKSLLVSLGLAAAACAITLPSGNEVPEALEVYLDCPVGDTSCYNFKVRTCNNYYEICESGEPEMLGEYLQDQGYDIGNLNPGAFCEIHKEVCNYIFEYQKPITEADVYNYKDYLSCGETDFLCQYDKLNHCNAVLEQCKEQFPAEDCQLLSVVCDGIVQEEEEEIIEIN